MGVVSFTRLLPMARSAAPRPARTRARPPAPLLAPKPPGCVLCDEAGPRVAPSRRRFVPALVRRLRSLTLTCGHWAAAKPVASWVTSLRVTGPADDAKGGFTYWHVLLKAAPTGRRCLDQRRKWWSVGFREMTKNFLSRRGTGSAPHVTW